MTHPNEQVVTFVLPFQTGAGQESGAGAPARAGERAGNGEGERAGTGEGERAGDGDEAGVARGHVTPEQTAKVRRAGQQARFDAAHENEHLLKR